MLSRHLLERSILRATNAARWSRTALDEPGHCHFNTHHQTYQASLEPGGRFFGAEPTLVELNEAQFDLWLSRMRQIRAMARSQTAPAQADTEALAG